MPNGSSNNTIGSAVQKEASLPTDMLLEYQRKDFRKALDIPDSSRMPPLVRTILIIAFFTVGLLLCATVSFGAVQFIRNVAQVQPSPTFEIPIATFSPTVTVTFTFTPPSTATQSPMNTYTPTPTNVTPTPEKPKAVFIEGCVTSNGLRIRAAPSFEALTIAWLVMDDCRLFDARTEDDKWLRTQLEAGQENESGWVSAKYLEINDGVVDDLDVIQPQQ